MHRSRNFHASDTKYNAKADYMVATDSVQCDFRTGCIGNFKMVSTPAGSGMGSSGLVGQFAAYDAMVSAGTSIPVTMIEIMVMHFILPGILTFIIAQGFRKAGWIKDGDMALKLD